MMADCLLRGGKKFCHLLLVKPYFPVFGIEGDRGPTISGAIDDDILLLVHILYFYDVNSYTENALSLLLRGNIILL